MTMKFRNSVYTKGHQLSGSGFLRVPVAGLFAHNGGSAFPAVQGGHVNRPRWPSIVPSA